VGVDTAQRLAEQVWDRAAHDEALFTTTSAGLLVCVIDSEGREQVWIESGKASEPRGEDAREPANVRKHISKRIAQADASSAAAVWLVRYRGTLVGRVDWLFAIAVDGAGDAGYFARVRYDDDGAPSIGPRTDWPARRRAPFEESEIPRMLDPLRGAWSQMLNQGLRDAARQRRREARRGKQRAGAGLARPERRP
jgi:hypothetical protein